VSSTIKTALDQNAPDHDEHERDRRLEVLGEVWSGRLALDPEEALAHFRRALQLDPDCKAAVRGLARALRRSASLASVPSEPVDVLADAVVTLDRDEPVQVGALAAAVEPAEPLPAPARAVSPNAASPSHLARPLASSLPSASLPKRVERPSDITNPNFWVPVAYLVAIALAEALTVTVFPQGGLVLHGLLFVTLMVHTALMPRAPQQRAMLAAAFGPLIRLLSLSIPLAHVPLIYWYMIVGAPLFAAAFFTARAMRYTPAKIGLTLGSLPTQLIIGASGIFLGYLEHLILQPQPLVSSTHWEEIAAAALILFVFTGFLEEVIFRGVMQRALSEGIGRYGMLYVAVLFAVLHLGYHSALDFVFVLVVALYFGLVVRRTGSILGVTIAHGLTNTTMFLFFPFIQPSFVSPAPEAVIAAVAVASAAVAVLAVPALLRHPVRRAQPSRNR
jgi:membrane protease YdiL (CAAX protease family)